MQETRVWSLGQEDSPGEGNGYPLQKSCLENSMDRGAWWATVHGRKEWDTTEWLTLLLRIFQSLVSINSGRWVYCCLLHYSLDFLVKLSFNEVARKFSCWGLLPTKVQGEGWVGEEVCCPWGLPRQTLLSAQYLYSSRTQRGGLGNLEPSRAETAQGSWQVGPRKARGKSETRDA